METAQSAHVSVARRSKRPCYLRYPEQTYYLGAKWGRAILADVLGQAVTDGDVTEGEAVRAWRQIRKWKSNAAGATYLKR
jgi:hypothetical protein